MKTTFKEVINNFEDDLINCEDMNIDIDINRVKEQVFERLNTDMENTNINNKKRYTKRFKVTLIAAVVAVSMLLCTTAYATGALQSIFGGFFGGNLNSAGLYDGKNVTFESPDPNINAQLLGITGDERQTYAMIEVSHKDGTPITDEGYIYPVWTTLYDTENVDDEDYYKSLVFDTYLIDKNGESIGHLGPCYEMSEDAKTLKILIKIPNGDYDMNNYTLVIENRAIGAHNVPADTNNKPSEVDFKKFDCPFTMSFDIDIENTNYINKTLTTKNAPNLVLPEANEVNMEITPFAINITSKADMQVYKEKGANLECKFIDFICCETIDYNNSKVILNDGTEYFLYYYPSGSHQIVNEGTENEYYEEVIVLNFSKVIAPLEAEVNLIDTREIKAIIINGDTVYGRN